MTTPDTSLTHEQVDHVIQGMRVPVQPQIMVDLQMEQAMPDPDLEEIARLISRDVAISGKVLKAVNSPFFGLRNKITSIQKAVFLLGTDSIINLVNAIAIREEFSITADMPEDDIKYMNHFWDTAQDVALTSATIARQIGFISPDEAYILGLFHNAAVPMLMQKHKHYRELLQQSYCGHSKRIIDAENNAIQTNHAVLGFYIAKSWKLSSPICEAIQQHHNIIDLFSQSGQQGSDVMNLLSVLKMAEHIVGLYNIIGDQDKDFEWEESRELIFKYLSISEDDFEEINIACSDMGMGLKNKVC